MSEGPARIIDAHHHLWDLERIRYPWLLARGEPRFFGDPSPIQRNYRIEDFRRDIATLPVVDSVHVQVGAAPEHIFAETRWVQEVADRAGLPGAIVAFCDLSAPDVDACLDRHRQAPHLRGIRQIVGRARSEDADGPSLLDDPAWIRGLGRVAARDLSFDLQLVPGQIARAREVLSQQPDLRVAVCHAGSPGEPGPAGFDAWRRQMTRLAALPNVFCKLSGFVMFDHDWSIDSIRPYVLAAIEAFGPARCMFGSNFPVDRLYAGYRELWACYAAITRDFSATERDALFYDTARRFYRLGD